MSVGKRLRSEREKLALTQTEFAETCGVQKRVQIRFEKDENLPGGAYLIAAAAIGVDVYYVLTGLKQGESVQPQTMLTANTAVQMVASLMDEEGLQGKLTRDEIKVLVNFVLEHQADRYALKRFFQQIASIYRKDLVATKPATARKSTK